MDEEKKAAAAVDESSQDLKRGIAEWQVAFIGLGAMGAPMQGA